MGRYKGDYESISRVWNSQALDTRFVDEALGTNVLATPEQDTILPPVFITYAKQGTGCSFSINRPRVARLFINDTQYLVVPIPWQESTTNFNTFFAQIKDNPNILRVRYIGQTIQENSLRWHVRLNQ